MQSCKCNALIKFRWKAEFPLNRSVVCPDSAKNTITVLPQFGLNLLLNWNSSTLMLFLLLLQVYKVEQSLKSWQVTSGLEKVLEKVDEFHGEVKRAPCTERFPSPWVSNWGLHLWYLIAGIFHVQVSKQIYLAKHQIWSLFQICRLSCNQFWKKKGLWWK